LLTTSEAAHYLGRREYTVRKLVHDGELPVVQDGPGSPWKFDVRDLDDFIERKKQRA
jgi:excisionase family DNA binding protein